VAFSAASSGVPVKELWPDRQKCKNGTNLRKREEFGWKTREFAPKSFKMDKFAGKSSRFRKFVPESSLLWA
jgi:hypothetical protein